jgi:predicted acetyltransferase
MLVSVTPHSRLPADRNMAEFFILRKHRGRGGSRIAAEIIFSMNPGSWEVAVTRKNARALQFWRKTVLQSAKASNLQELDLQNDHWNGPVLRFDWGQSASGSLF